MRSAKKLWLIAGALLIVLGAALFCGVMTARHWDFSALIDKPDTVSFLLEGPVRSITIRSDTEDISFRPSDDGSCRVDFLEQAKVSPNADLRDGILSIGKTDDRKWYERLGFFSFGSSSITVYLPAGEYEALVIEERTGDLSIPADFRFASMDVVTHTGDIDCRASANGPIRMETSTGDVRLEGLSAASLDLSVSTGRVELNKVACEGDLALTLSTGKTVLTDLSCGNLSSAGSTGDLSLERVLAAGTLTLTRSTGDIRFTDCDAAELLIETSTGDVSGTLRSEKLFLARSDTGSIRVPETTSGGKCKITTDTGDIEITVP